MNPKKLTSKAVSSRITSGNVREKEKTIRNGKPSKKPVARGIISNELSLLRTVRNVYNREQVKKFVFHNYRNTALTDWADRGISADVAMQAAGHTSVQMHKRYLDLQRHHIANAFGLKSGDQKMVTKSVSRRKAARQVVDFTCGEGRCPVVPLVFKTSLGVVRSPEGSTPSLLRQNRKYCFNPHRNLPAKTRLSRRQF